MVFSVNKKDISEKLQSLLNIIPSKFSSMVLSYFHIDVRKETNTLTVVATDLNIMTKVVIPAEVEEDGALLIPAKHFSDIINSLPDALIHLAKKDDHLFIECGHSSFQISFMNVDIFPELSKISSETVYEIEADNFKKIVQNGIFCASTDSSLSICNGILFRIEDHALTLVSTDTKRVAEASCKTEFTHGDAYEVVIPPRALSFIERNITADTQSIAIKYDEHRVSFSLPGIELITNKFEGRFPNYLVAFKNEPTYTLILDKNQLKAAIHRVSILSEDEDKLIKCSLQEGMIVIESLTSEKGSAKESIDELTYDGPECFFCLNSRFLASFINVIETDEIVIKFRSTEEPFWIANNAEYEFIKLRFVVMPIRVNR